MLSSLSRLLAPSLITPLLVALPLLAAESSRWKVDAHGGITYSNEACPSGTARERGVEDRPPVETVPGTATGQAPHEGSNSVRATVPSGTSPPVPPESAREISAEQRKVQIARCDDLVHRIEYGQQDMLSAAPSERASIELGIRRLQAEHEANCVRH